MVNRLDPINLVDYTGGLNLRRNQFQLAENESPDMLNVDIDPRGGFFTRKGWQRWNQVDIVDPATTAWAPRNAFVITYPDGDQAIFVVNNHVIYRAGTDAVFTPLAGVVADANPHGADFSSWGEEVFIAPGMLQPAVRVNRAGAVTVLDPDGWSEVDAPTLNVMPQAEYVCGHASYLFIAGTVEAGVNRHARVRWSHPNRPDAWRETDFLDIDTGGGRITGIMSFRDHLLIFKTNSMWALYGYDEDSWQLIKVSISVGCPSITAATRNEQAAFFFSASDRGGIYAYSGDAPTYISEQLRPAFEDIIAFENVFVSWAGRRLWAGVPWTKTVGSTTDLSTCFVFDPDVGGGAWTMYRSEYGAIAPVIDGSDVNARYPLAALWSPNAAVMVTVDAIEDAYDLILDPYVLGTTPPDDDPGYLVTSLDEEIELTGAMFTGQPFESYYRTRWLHAGWPDRKKSWRRPTFICREVAVDTELLVESYRDYDETTVHRTRTLKVRTKGGAYWTEGGYVDHDIGGFDWKELGRASPDERGADWGAAVAGSRMIRGGSMGLARSVQMRVRASPASPRQRWGVDGIVAKYVMRRFR
jgi:hypothetical protein